MKIGAFSRKNNLSIDSVRHYMNLNLIIPEKRGGHYHFDQRCQQDVEDVLNFKGMGFSLNEIKIIFKYKRLGKITDYEQDEYYKTLFTGKLESLRNNLEELNRYKNNLEMELNGLREKEKNETVKIGVPLKALSVLRCHHCAGELDLLDGKVECHQVMEGRLGCACGEEYIIDSGILSGSAKKENKAERKKEYTQQISEYINCTDPYFLDHLSEGLEWSYKVLDFEEFSGKHLLELGTGFGYFLRYIYHNLPEDCLYIAVDHNLNKQRFVKGLLERSGIKKNILFVASDFLSIPIKKKSADVLLDISGTSNYSFENKKFLLGLTDSYIKDQSLFIGSYILFNQFSRKSYIKEDYRDNFILRNIQAGIQRLGYEILYQKKTKDIEIEEDYREYFAKGEKIALYMVLGKR